MSRLMTKFRSICTIVSKQSHAACKWLRDTTRVSTYVFLCNLTDELPGCSYHSSLSFNTASASIVVVARVNLVHPIKVCCSL